MSPIVWTLLALLAVSAGFNVAQFLAFRKTTAELLDRLMARDLPEFNAMRQPRRPRTPPLTDEQLALRDEARRAAQGAAVG